MKVLYITHYSGFYGANRSLLKLICELRELYGVEPLVIIPMHGTFVDELERENISYRIYKFYNWQNGKINWLKLKTKDVINRVLFYSIWKQLERENFKFDLIHTNTSITNLGGFLSKTSKKPHVWHIREFGKQDQNAEYSCGIIKAGRYYNKHATIVVAISKAIKEYYSKYIDSNKIVVIYNGVAVNTNYKRAYNKNSPIQISFVGVITSNKNQLEAIKACEYLINHKNNKNFVLTIVGDGPDNYYHQLVDYVKNNNLSENVKFTGYVDNVDGILNTTDIGLVCSKKEAFGRVTVEYMSKKITVIASNSGANPELIDDSNTGFLYKLGDYKALAESINKVILNRDVLEEIGDSAHNKALSKYNSQLNSTNIYKLYKEVCVKGF